MTRYRSFWAIMSLTVLSGIGIAADQYAVTYERNVEVKMRDGVTLKADIFRPQAEGKFPVLLQRTPYNKDNGVDFGLNAAARGYVVTPWSGRRRCRIPTEKSGCLADLMLGRRKCSQP